MSGLLHPEPPFSWHDIPWIVGETIGVLVMGFYLAKAWLKRSTQMTMFKFMARGHLMKLNALRDYLVKHPEHNKVYVHPNDLESVSDIGNVSPDKDIPIGLSWIPDQP